MTDLCLRCTHLFKECRPLLGASCPRSAAVPMPTLDVPEISAAADWIAVVVQDAQTGNLKIQSTVAVDFYEGRP